jgi:plastocyanin
MWLLTFGIVVSALAMAGPPAATPVPTGQLRAVVTVTGADGRTAKAAEAVVWIPGLGNYKESRPAARLVMSSKDKRFEPRVLAVPVGVPVSFPNLDKIFHNVFSLSDKNRFDLGLYRNGASRTTTFEHPGVVRVYCNIHPQMASYVVVVDGTFYGRTSPDGVVLLSAVPAGRHPLRAWDERGGEWSGSVEVLPGRTVEIAVGLDARGWRDQPHKNKYGKSYPPPGDNDNRY